MAQAVNNFTITGNICQDPKIGTTENGKKYAFITLAVHGMNKENPDFLSFIIWEKLAENVVKYCTKGDCISAHGIIKSIKKGNDTRLQLTADSVTFLHKAAKKTAEEPKKAEPENDVFMPVSGDIFSPF